jgi:hypothetical protein
VRVTLTFPTDTLVDLLGPEAALDELTSLAVRYLDKSGKDCSDVKCLLVQHLCCDLLQADSALAETFILLTLLPFLMPVKEKEIDVMITLINQHSFINKCKFLSALIKGKLFCQLKLKFR